MLNPRELKAFLGTHELQLIKRLGQHHLIDAQVVSRVLSHLAVAPGQRVVEIGPGLGALTQPLAAQGTKVIAIEIDRKVAHLLRERLRAYPQVEVVCEDILTYAWPLDPPVIVLGAIPYHITSEILVSLFAHRALIQQAVLIMQRQVAARLVASPGTKAYGRLSLLVQYAWAAERLFDIPPGAFFPPPRVDSTCVQLRPHAAAPVAVRDEQALFALVKAAFAQRRKTLVNTLTHDPQRPWGTRETIQQALRHLQLPLSVRGEALSLPQFAALANELALR
jgi:16S rRNA (adenine1518-N6/adenine1519-N6)-dimethyltransferase